MSLLLLYELPSIIYCFLPIVHLSKLFYYLSSFSSNLDLLVWLDKAAIKKNKNNFVKFLVIMVGSVCHCVECNFNDISTLGGYE